jgi:hypothetical protein
LACPKLTKETYSGWWLFDAACVIRPSENVVERRTRLVGLKEDTEVNKLLTCEL